MLPVPKWLLWLRCRFQITGQCVPVISKKWFPACHNFDVQCIQQTVRFQPESNVVFQAALYAVYDIKHIVSASTKFSDSPIVPLCGPHGAGLPPTGLGKGGARPVKATAAAVGPGAARQGAWFDKCHLNKWVTLLKRWGWAVCRALFCFQYAKNL